MSSKEETPLDLRSEREEWREAQSCPHHRIPVRAKGRDGKALGNWEDTDLELTWGRWVEAQESATLKAGKLPLCPHLMNTLCLH